MASICDKFGSKATTNISWWLMVFLCFACTTTRVETYGPIGRNINTINATSDAGSLTLKVDPKPQDSQTIWETIVTFSKSKGCLFPPTGIKEAENVCQMLDTPFTPRKHLFRVDYDHLMCLSLTYYSSQICSLNPHVQVDLDKLAVHPPDDEDAEDDDICDRLGESIKLGLKAKLLKNPTFLNVSQVCWNYCIDSGLNRTALCKLVDVSLRLLVPNVGAPAKPGIPKPNPTISHDQPAANVQDVAAPTPEKANMQNSGTKAATVSNSHGEVADSSGSTKLPVMLPSTIAGDGPKMQPKASTIGGSMVKTIDTSRPTPWNEQTSGKQMKVVAPSAKDPAPVSGTIPPAKGTVIPQAAKEPAEQEDSIMTPLSPNKATSDDASPQSSSKSAELPKLQPTPVQQTSSADGEAAVPPKPVRLDPAITKVKPVSSSTVASGAAVVKPVAPKGKIPTVPDGDESYDPDDQDGNTISVDSGKDVQISVPDDPQMNDNEADAAEAKLADNGIAGPKPKFPEYTDSHFFTYFLTVVVLCIVVYLVFHNKQKIIALIIEGRHERRRRPSTANYKKLDSNLEEVMQETS